MNATRPQQDPHEGKDDVTDLVIAALQQRRTLGVAKYGRPLQTFNGRDPLRDLLEELLDGACYCMQAIAERDGKQP